MSVKSWKDDPKAIEAIDYLIALEVTADDFDEYYEEFYGDDEEEEIGDEDDDEEDG